MAVSLNTALGAFPIPALAGTAYVPLAGGTMTGTLTIASGTLTASAPALNITQTWNEGSTTFTAINVTVTNTASGGGYFFNSFVGGVSQFNVDRGGGLYWGAAAGGAADANYVYTKNLALTNGSTRYAVDVILTRDAAASLALRNGTNAQTLRVYRSYTDASNYSRFTHGWNTSTALLMAEGLGTGTDGNVAFNDEALATGATRGYIMVPSAAGVSTGRPADIPTGQTPIVFDSTNKRIGAYTGDAWVWTAALA